MAGVYREERRRLPRPGDDLPETLWADANVLVPLIREQARGDRFYGNFARSLAPAVETEAGMRTGTAVTRELAGSRGAGKYVARLMGGRVRQLDGSAAGSDSEESEDEEEDEEDDDDVPRARRSEGGGGFEDAETTVRKRARRANVMSGLAPGGKRMPSYSEHEEQLMYRGRAMGLSWDDLGTILPLRTKRSISKFYYGTLKKKMGGDPSPVPNFHDAERRAMKTACGEAQARGEDLDYGLVAEAANEARRELVDEPGLPQPRNAVDAEIFCRLDMGVKYDGDGEGGDDDDEEEEDAGDDDVRGKTTYGTGLMGRAAGLWQDWEQEAIYRMRRTGQSWEDINTAVPERTLPAIKKLWYMKLSKKSPEEMGLPADLPNAEEDAKRGDGEHDEDDDDDDDLPIGRLGGNDEAEQDDDDDDDDDDDVPLTSLL